MRELLELAAARRAEIDAELREIDAFLARAEDLFGPLRLLAGSVPGRAGTGREIIPFPRGLRAGGRYATADAPGA